MSVCTFNSLCSGKDSNHLIAAASSSEPFSGETSLSVKNLYLPTFYDDKAEILAISLSKMY